MLKKLMAAQDAHNQKHAAGKYAPVDEKKADKKALRAEKDAYRNVDLVLGLRVSHKDKTVSHGIETPKAERVTIPVTGSTASVVTEGELNSRVTVTRLLATGIFAFALKKNTGLDVFIIIENPDVEAPLVHQVPAKKAQKAREFARLFNALPGAVAPAGGSFSTQRTS